MRHRIWILALLAGMLTWSLCAAGARAEDFFFKDADAVVIIGDSITEQHLYSNYVEMWTVTRFANSKITFRNVGIGGDRSPGGSSRFKRDVLYHKPTSMTVDFGMNDGRYQAFDASHFKTYMQGLQGIADQAKAANIRVAWITPSPVEKKVDGPAIEGYNQTLEKFSAGVKEIAFKNGGVFIDQFHPFIEIQDKARAADSKNRIGGGDEIHPGAPGQAVMAWAILKGLHFPAQVSSVEIKLSSNDVFSEASHCTVTDVQTKNGSIRFQRQDDALPFFPEEAQSILQWAAILEDLNQYTLKVTGLNSGRYEIRFGSQKVAEHTAAELAAGVNLAAAALKAGPVADQVKAVWKAVKEKNRYYHERIFRGVVLVNVGEIPDWLGIKLTRPEVEAKRQAALEERMKKMPEYDAAIRKELVMKPYSVEIISREK